MILLIDTHKTDDTKLDDKLPGERSIEQFTDADYIDMIDHIDENLGHMTVVFSLISGFIVTIFIDFYIDKSYPGLVVLIFLGLLGIFNSLGIALSLYCMIIPNDVNELKNFYFGKFGFEYGFQKEMKENTLTQKVLFYKVKRKYTVVRQFFLLAIYTLVIFIITMVVSYFVILFRGELVIW